MAIGVVGTVLGTAVEIKNPINDRLLRQLPPFAIEGKAHSVAKNASAKAASYM